MKGWVDGNNVMKNFGITEIILIPNLIHVHQTSPDAIQGEAVVKPRYLEGQYPANGFILLRPELIGKRVKYIVYETLD